MPNPHHLHEALAHACTRALELVDHATAQKPNRPPLSDAETNRRNAALDAIRSLLADTRLPHPETSSPTRLAERLAALPRYPAAIVLQCLLETTSLEQRVALCDSLLEATAPSPNSTLAHLCLEPLEQAATPAATTALVRCLHTHRLAGLAAQALMRSLGFPVVGDAARLADRLARGPDAEASRNLLELLGVDPDTLEFDPRRAAAFHGPTHSDLAEIQARPDQVVLADLHGQPLRALPEELRRCPNLRYLVLDDDYFQDHELTRLEAELPGVDVRWTRGMYVDGKHGR